MNRDEVIRMDGDRHAQTILELRENAERIFAAAKHRDRRERIATVCMAALLTKYGVGPEDEKHSAYAVAFADALIAELDKEAQS